MDGMVASPSLGDMALTVGIGRGGALALSEPGVAPAPDEGMPPGLALTTAQLMKLSDRIGRAFEVAAAHRKSSGVDDRLNELLLMSLGRYSPDEEMAIRATHAPLLYVPVADKKHRAGAAMLGELFNNPGDKCWSLSATPDPTVPKWVRDRAIGEVLRSEIEMAEAEGRPLDRDEVRAAVLRRMDEIDGARREFARNAALRMERKIHDQMVENGWVETFNAYTDDVCVFGTGVVRGPEPRVRRTTRYVEGKNGTGGRVKVVEEMALSFEAVSPMDCYPAPGARNIDEGPLVIRVRYTPDQFRLASRLPNVKGGRKGWIPDAVEAILRSSPQGGVAGADDRLYRTTDADGAKRDTSVADDPSGSCLIEGLEYFGEARGSELLGLGIREDADGKAVEPADYYEVDAIRVDGLIVYCRIVEPEIGRPLCKGVFYQQNDSWWGVGPLEKCRDAQRLCNAAVRNLAVNMAQAAGPQFAITDFSRLDPACGTDMTPWKLWSFGPPPFGQGGNANPIQMFQPSSNAAELLRVEEFFDKMCDELSGIPAYTMGGGGSGEIGRTASGYSMLMESATRGFKHAVHQTDTGVIRPMVMRIYAWNMMHEPDETLKGDVRCNPSGLMGQILKEQDYNRKVQFLQLTNNPTDLQIVGIPGRARLLREVARPMEISLDDIVRSPETLEREQRLAELRQQAETVQAVDAARAGGMQPEGEAPEESSGGAPAGGRRNNVPQPGTGITPQARGAMAAVARNPQARAMQGMRAARTRAAARAAAS